MVLYLFQSMQKRIRETRTVLQEPEKPSHAPLYVIFTSAAASFVVGLAVVKGVGYSVISGLMYGIVYFGSMVLFFEASGYTLFRSNNE